MAFDGIFTHAMIHELKQQLIGGRVTKISQPYDNEVILTIRANRKNYPVLFSAHPVYARFQITKMPYKNPPTPTNFTMVLRKYLENARLIEIKQQENDRIANFYFETRNEIGDQLPLILSIEIMNRYSNVILIDQQSNTIIDTIKHIGISQNRYRTLLPGATYRRAPQQNKKNPFDADLNDFEILLQKYPNREVLAKNIQQTFQGFAKTSALQLADTLHANNQKNVAENLKAFLDSTNDPTPSLSTDSKDDFTFTDLGIGIKNVSQEFSTLSSLLDNFYEIKATKERVRQQGAKLIHVVNQELKKNRKKLKKLEKEFENTKNADDYRIKGELLTTYLTQVKRGMTSITLPNYYDDNREVKIELSNQISPSQNAQKYFKKYQKLKNAISYLTKQIELTKNEIKYFEEIQSQIELADVKDLTDIQFELINGGYLHNNQHARKQKRKVKINQPEIFWATDGTKISVGKNNLQNEKLTLHTTKKTDYWLHVKNVPGSHVIIHDADPSKDTLLEAANLAAYFSKSRNSANVAVDYVQVKKIKKPNGAKPGFVTYTGQKTLYVTPDKTAIDELTSN